ncbi:MAG: hypothetical protein NW207_08405 [Cytophagales bacterium]|nr:hypothetical protein [Cytophagales bacterium]
MLDYTLFYKKNVRLQEGAIHIELQSRADMIRFDTAKRGLLTYIKEKTGNIYQAVPVLNEDTKTEENVYTPTDKFNKIAKEYEILHELKRRLGLETDYNI